MHRCWTEINAPRPLDTPKIAIDRYRLKNVLCKERRKERRPSCRIHRIDSFQPIIETNAELIIRQWRCFNNSYHTGNLL
jgi:hypothetical protein